MESISDGLHRLSAPVLPHLRWNRDMARVASHLYLLIRQPCAFLASSLFNAKNRRVVIRIIADTGGVKTPHSEIHWLREKGFNLCDVGDSLNACALSARLSSLQTEKGWHGGCTKFIKRTMAFAPERTGGLTKGFSECNMLLRMLQEQNRLRIAEMYMYVFFCSCCRGFLLR